MFGIKLMNMLLYFLILALLIYVRSRGSNKNIPYPKKQTKKNMEIYYQESKSLDEHLTFLNMVIFIYIVIGFFLLDSECQPSSGWFGVC